MSERTILAAENKDFDELNDIIHSDIQSETVTHKSVGTVVQADEAVNYPIAFLLTCIDLPRMLPHVLQLKIGVLIIMLRNINQSELCNGTRFAVKKLMSDVVEATVLTGPFKGEDILIPLIPMIPMDMSFQFKRLQFPIQLAFAFIINKTHGQSLKLCGLDLETNCFSHDNNMLLVLESVNQTISLSAQTMEQQKMLYALKYYEIKHIRCGRELKDVK